MNFAKKACLIWAIFFVLVSILMNIFQYNMTSDSYGDRLYSKYHNSSIAYSVTAIGCIILSFIV